MQKQKQKQMQKQMQKQKQKQMQKQKQKQMQMQARSHAQTTTQTLVSSALPYHNGQSTSYVVLQRTSVKLPRKVGQRLRQPLTNHNVVGEAAGKMGGGDLGQAFRGVFAACDEEVSLVFCSYEERMDALASPTGLQKIDIASMKQPIQKAQEPD